MRNLILSEEHLTYFNLEQNEYIVAMDSLSMSSQLLAILTNNGRILFVNSEDLLLVNQSVNLNVEDIRDKDWFNITTVMETNTIVCISHSGSIVQWKTLDFDPDSVEIEGQVDEGLASASWNTDRSILALLTRNNTLLLMTCYFEVIVEKIVSGVHIESPSTISWRGDGSGFTLLNRDGDADRCKIQFFTKDAEFVELGRNVADGPSSIILGIGNCIAYSPNCTLVAFPLHKTSHRLQIAFLEPNGLRHGEFDLKLPGPSSHTVSSIHWDLASTVLAVSLSVVGSDNYMNLVQLYIRNNYHWYLKQQFSGYNLQCLGFDSEIVHRLYLAQSVNDFEPETSILRAVDLAWDVCTSDTPDGSVAVIDGNLILLSPLGLSVVPPPMCAHKVELPSPVSAISFSRPCICHDCVNSQPTNPEWIWGLACLCDGATMTYILGKSGCPFKQVQSDLLPIIEHAISTSSDSSKVPCSASDFSFRSIAVSTCLAKNLCNSICVAVLINWLNPVASSTFPAILALRINVSDGSIAAARLLRDFIGPMVRIMPFLLLCEHIAVCINSNNGYVVHVVNTNLSSGTDAKHFEVLMPESSVGFDPIYLPEFCYQMSILTIDSAAMDSCTKWAVIGLSRTNRLYCGHDLIAAGVANFGVNSLLGILIFVTVGTRPAVHYMDLLALIGLGDLHGLQTEEHYYLECGEPRPVERGARLVISVPGEARTIIQLPRGNLEVFEPRPLVLTKARKILNQFKLYECLVMLRRQKVDLNYIVDFDPAIFFSNVNKFVTQTLDTNVDYLSLFISSLEPNIASVFKYPIAVVGKVGQSKKFAGTDKDSDFVFGSYTSKDMNGPFKVNAVCTAIRNQLEELMSQGRNDALYPILCTYARERPARLEEALDVLSNQFYQKKQIVSYKPTENAYERAAILAGPKAQAAIKYLAFLADGSKLFEAAVGKCDFSLARAVARQCQMDPKVYMPLLDGFESLISSVVDKEYELIQFREVLMRFEVNLYLNRHSRCIETAVGALLSWQALKLKGISDPSTDTSHSKARSISSICDVIYKIATDQNLLPQTIFRVTNAVLQIQLQSTAIIDGTIPQPQIAIDLLNRLKMNYGSLCISKQLYDEAMSAYLTCNPPEYTEAIRAAKLGLDWQGALSIAGRQAIHEKVDPKVVLRKLATEIVSSFKESLDQGDNDAHEGCSILPAYLAPVDTLNTYSNADHSNLEAVTIVHDSKTDRATQAAQICLDYCEDAESAVNILVTVRQWSQAIQVAIRYSRLDLLSGEIAPAVRDACLELMKILPAISYRQKELCDQLAILWKDPAERLTKVKEAEPESFKTKIRGADPDGNPLIDGKVAGSEFSAASNLSRVSYISHASALSSRSGTSSVSVLSSVALHKDGSNFFSVDKSDTFSISGIDHALLSRGKTTNRPDGSTINKGGQLKGISEKRQRKWDRKKSARHFGSDTMELRTENSLCTELWSLSNIAAVAKEASALCTAMVLLGSSQTYSRSKLPISVINVLSALRSSVESEDQNAPTVPSPQPALPSTIDIPDVLMSAFLQSAVDELASCVRSCPPPVAPHYPLHFLESKQMKVVQRFQDMQALQAEQAVVDVKGSGADDDGVDMLDTCTEHNQEYAVSSADAGGAIKTWWQTAADGILLWQKLRRSNLSI